MALVPDLVPKLTGSSLEVVVEAGAGAAAGFPDSWYQEKGARLERDAIGGADILLKVQPPNTDEIARLREGATLIGFLLPYTNAAAIKALAERRVTAFSMELMPRIARAQPMDALSAMSMVAGYKAVLLAANRLPKFFPLLMTAAGTLIRQDARSAAADSGASTARVRALRADRAWLRPPLVRQVPDQRALPVFL
ncbi:MAG TPA: hypothetical protein VGJ53_15320, partial [Micromonosporaceae bacterium]